MALLPIVSFRTTIESVHLIPHDSIGGHGNCKNQEMAKITEISSNTRKSTPVAAPAHLKSILRSPRYSNYTDTRNPNTTSTKNANDNLRDSAPIQTAVPYTKRQRKAKHAASKDTKFFFLFQQKMKDFESRPFSMTKHDHNDCSPDQLLSDLNRSFAAFRTRMQMASLQHDTDRQAATRTDTTIRNCTSVQLSAPSTSFSGNGMSKTDQLQTLSVQTIHKNCLQATLLIVRLPLQQSLRVFLPRTIPSPLLQWYLQNLLQVRLLKDTFPFGPFLKLMLLRSPRSKLLLPLLHMVSSIHQ